jgi:hypothetical protein
MRTASIRPVARRAPLAAVAAWTLTACAGALAAPPLPLGQPTAADVTTRQINGPVLQAQPTRMLSEVVSTYWPMLGLQPRGPLVGDAGEQVGLYANGQLIGGLADLRSIASGNVLYLQRLTRTEEFSRFGRSHPQGAIILAWRMR